MTAKHTPGPWFIHGEMTKYVESLIGGGLVQEIAAVGPTLADNGYGDQQLANARLIAAAPDLLDALSKLYEAYCSVMSSEFDFPGRPWTPERDGGDADALLARAAIAKATGGQQ